MASSSSSTTHHFHLNPYNTPTTAPPPTPSTQPSTSTTTTTIHSDTLTRLLQRLPPTLCFPSRRLSPRSSTTITPLPTISLSSETNTTEFNTCSFQLASVDHLITPQLAHSAELEGLSLFHLGVDKRHALFPKEWPFGYDQDEDDTPSFCLSPNKTTTESSLTSLGELSHELEKVGLNVVEKLARTMGFENPFRENGSSLLMWVSLLDGEKMGKLYPYVVGLQYQIRARKWSLNTDSGPLIVEPEVGSVLVTFGDIAQVWSNGKVNKVRGRPNATLEAISKPESPSISMMMLLTLPLESVVSPARFLHPTTTAAEASKPKKGVSSTERDNDDQNAETSNVVDSNDDDDNEDWKVFKSFSFEDYAWSVYNDRLPLKDPLDRYRKPSI